VSTRQYRDRVRSLLERRASAVEAGDADQIDAEPEGRGLAGCWGRVRVLHCCRRWCLVEHAD
jgi:hypothetical protein